MKTLTCTLMGILWINVAIAQQPVTSTVTPDTDDKPTSFWMEKKLEYSSAILRGLAVNDFQLLESNARQLQMLNKVEGFIRRRNPEYRKQVEMFERVTDELIRQSERKNSDGVALAFNQLTVSCVRCHQALREQEAK